MASEEEELRQDIELLKDTVSELISEHNHMTLYIEDLRNRLSSHLMFKWYRFIVWLWPMPLPLYRRRVVVNRFRKRDRRPVLRTAPASTPAPEVQRRDRAPRAPRGA